MSAGSLVRSAAATPKRLAVRARTRSWQQESRLFAVGERSGWSVDEDATNLEDAARRLGFEVGQSGWAAFCERQSVFLTSHFEALGPRWLASSHRLGTAYLHGRPGTPGYPEFDAAYDALARDAERFACIQVTHAEMRELVLSAGVPEERVFDIRIGVDLESFPLVDAERRTAARRALDLADDAFVVGSFQKDGVGWEEGLEPKLVKGPDVLVEALGLVRERIPELAVLLTAPARGYVRRELERRGIPHVHTRAADRAELARAYHALDVYVVPSRQEGGPKGALESMAAGIPLVSTRVGQAQDIVDEGRNGLLVEVEDVTGIAAAILRLRDDRGLPVVLSTAGRATAEEHAHECLDPAWDALLRQLVSARTQP